MKCHCSQVREIESITAGRIYYRCARCGLRVIPFFNAGVRLWVHILSNVDGML